MVDDHFEKYEATTTKREKARIIQEIVQKIVCHGGRFLKEPQPFLKKLNPRGAHDMFWVEIDRQEAHRMVGKTFWTIRRLKAKTKAEAKAEAKANAAMVQVLELGGTPPTVPQLCVSSWLRER